MHPEIARAMIAQRNSDLLAMARRPRPSRRPLSAGRRRPRLALPRTAIPVWHVTWSRVASPVGPGGGRAWLIVISARRAVSIN